MRGFHRKSDEGADTDLIYSFCWTNYNYKVVAAFKAALKMQ